MLLIMHYQHFMETEIIKAVIVRIKIRQIGLIERVGFYIY